MIRFRILIPLILLSTTLAVSIASKKAVSSPLEKLTIAFMLAATVFSFIVLLITIFVSREVVKYETI